MKFEYNRRSSLNTKKYFSALSVERLRAQKIGYEDPINESYEATTDMYHRTLSENLRRIVRRGDRKTAVMVATHNEDTVRFTVNK
ncbi:UNVERIFIED_CONTAM: slgA [Trichonephila clavipes]